MHPDKIKTPIVLILAGKDQLIRNHEIQNTLSRVISPANVKTVLLPKDHHLALIENPVEATPQITAAIDENLKGQI
jgi:pimeloyl-ACP methyl ester carboxylesterase